MKKVESQIFSNYVRYADTIEFGKVYPLSIAEKVQNGDIFTNTLSDHQTILFWHYSGFAFLSGKYDKSFLEFVYKLMLNKSSEISRRFILFVNNKHIEEFFHTKDNIVVERRYFFEYLKECHIVNPVLPVGYELREIDAELLPKIKGKIVPAFSWHDSREFLSKGKGYCITNGNEIAAWAFSAAISSKEIDIGIETNAEYRNHGFATIVAKKMIQYILAENKIPVWACHYKNSASKKLAEKVGFIKTSECSIIKIKET